MMILWWVLWHWLVVMLLVCAGWCIHRWGHDQDPAIDAQQAAFMTAWKQARR